ncbi:MAG: DUF2520 domain-containing protein [Sphingomonadales bacterium]|jgi:predicted short-subunit dehydrogenase-like oxidoreductase (DUF2520 family)
MLPHKWYIAGTGNMGSALGDLLQKSDDIEFGGWLSRNVSSSFEPVFDFETHTDKSAGVFLCIPDRFIASAATALKQRFSAVVHCSGMQPLFQPCDAVCWPMQTFSAQVPPVWNDVPVFIESRLPELGQALTLLFQKAGSKPLISGLHERQTAHLAAVIANNFSNAMFVFAGEVLTASDLDPKMLLPIIRQTVQKLQHLNPNEAQTGPAIRADYNSIELQAELLKNKPEWQRLYSEISTAIPILFKK